MKIGQILKVLPVDILPFCFALAIVHCSKPGVGKLFLLEGRILVNSTSV